MKILLAVVVVLIGLLQYRLWYATGNGGVKQVMAYQQKLNELNIEVEKKSARNKALYAEVEDLRNGRETLEERAREELGMIREGETFFQILE